MLENHTNILLFKTKKLYYFISFCLTIITQVYSLSNPLNGRNPNTLLLQNGKLFIANENGMFIYGTNLQNKYKEYIYFNKTVDISNIDMISQNTLIAQFQETDGMIICLVENAIYFFDYEGNFLHMDFLPESDYSGFYINLLTYKKVSDNYYYIISYIRSDSLHILYYKVNNVKNGLIHQEIFKPFYFEYPKITINGNALGCQIMNSQDVGKVLTCSFQTREGPFIIVQSFIIEQQFEPIGDNIYSKVESPGSRIIHSLSSQNGKKLLTCYREDNMYGYCFIFDIDLNKIIRNEPLIKKCSDNYNKFKLFYIHNFEKYVFACLSEDKKFTIMLMDDNFNILNYNNFSDYNFIFNYDFNTFSIIYDEQETKYALIIDPRVEKNDENGNVVQSFFTEKYFITTNFNNNYDGGELPSSFGETPPCNEGVKLDKDNRYFLNTIEKHRSITVNEKDGIIIDLLNEKLIETKNNKAFNKEIYALNFEEITMGQLKYFINGEEKEIIRNEKIFGQFKLKYIPRGNYPEQDKFVYSVHLRNISMASEITQYWLITCRINCSCLSDMSQCPTCAEGYSSFQFVENCVLGTDICPNRFYTDNTTYLMVCLNETENNCPIDYPFYNEKTKECKQIKIDNSEEISITNGIQSIITYPYTDSESTILKAGTTIIEESTILKAGTTIIEESTILKAGTTIIEESTIFKPDTTIIEGSTIIKPDTTIIEGSTIFKPDTTNIEESTILKAGSTIIEENTKSNDLIDTTTISDLINEENFQKILDLIHKFNNTENFEEIEQPEKMYRLLSYMIQNGIINISSSDEDIILKGSNITYQITNSNNQKNADRNAVYSIIDLGECEKIIKRNISNEDDPTPLIILKIDLKKEEMKSNMVKYEIYNPNTKKKINLDICSDIKINLISPVDLTSDETTIYDDLKNQGYDRYDENNSFYSDICTTFTSQNGTDVILIDRQNYYYDKNATFCENYCIYKGISTDTQKVVCCCDVQNEVDFNLKFDTEKFLENFYKVQDYTNYEILQCFSLVFSLKGIKNNILFYIYIIFFTLFFSSMIVNLFRALTKIDEIIFTIFRDRFMYEIMINMIKTKKENDKIKMDSKDENNDNKIDEEQDSDMDNTKKINIFEKLKLKYRKEKEEANNNGNNNNNNDNNNNINNDNNNNNNNNDNINNDNNINNMNNDSTKNYYIINNDNKSNISNIYSNNSNKKNKNIKKKNSNIYNIKDIKRDDANKKIYLKYRMNNKLNYSNDIRDKNFNFSNMLNKILNNKSCSLPLVKKNQLINSNNKNLNKSMNKNIFNNINKNDKKTSINKNLFITNIFNINLKDNDIYSLPQNQINDINQSNINNINNINQNPPKKIIKNQKPISSQTSSGKNNIFNYQNNIKKKLPRKTIDIFKYKSNNLLSNNTALISFKNEETLSKNQLIQKPCPIILEKQLIKENEKIKIEKPPEENKPSNKIRYIDEEINKMNYENALINDNRTYCQYYISLLKNKHLIILVFISNDDYNVFLLKFSLFIISLAIFFALNTLFFRDSTMTYIFLSKGKYDFLYQIPQVLYSTIISFVIIYILKILSLSQRDLIKIKKESNKKKAKIMANIAKRCLTIKLYIFFFIGIFLLIFCWYYITAFGAVYQNTQLHLIKDTLISFGISMLYPFIINLFPGIFRMQALKAKNKDKKCLYDVSKIIAWF